jgi:hypothetical protein
MIPQNITREHIRQMAVWIDENGIPDDRKPRKYHVIVDGKKYPPPYIICIANRYANGIELPAYAVNASEALRFLKKKGFQITPIGGEL